MKDGSLTCGEWWPGDENAKTLNKAGRFIRGTADSIEPGKVMYWLPLDDWNNKEALQDKSVKRITVGDTDREFSVAIRDFHRLEDHELPEENQYCLLLLHNGDMSGGSWSNAGIYVKDVGWFDHAPACGIINVKDVWAWSALSPRSKEKLEWPKYISPEELAAREEAERKKRQHPAYDPAVKFNYGYEIEVYLEKAYQKLKETYPWFTKKMLDTHYRFAIEEDEGSLQYIEYYKYKKNDISRNFIDNMDTGDDFIRHVVFCHEWKVQNANEEVAEYPVDYESVELLGGWYLEHYTFYKLKTGDYKVFVQAGDRTGGASREFFIPRSYFESETYSEFLDRYEELVPAGPFGLSKEELIKDEGLKVFLGY